MEVAAGTDSTPKVVCGIDTESGLRAALVLEQVVQNVGVRRVSSPRVAERTKLLENTCAAIPPSGLLYLRRMERGSADVT